MNKYFVYSHNDPLTGIIFYIGMGSGRRYIDTKSRNKKWNEKVSFSGFDYSIICSGLSKNDALELEVFVISEIGIKNLLNITKGGTCGPGAKTGKENPMFGKRGVESPRFGMKHTEQQRLNIAEGKSRNPYKMTDSNKLELSKRMIGNRYAQGLIHSEYFIEKLKKSMSGEGNPSFKKDEYLFVHDDGRSFKGTAFSFFSRGEVSRGNLSSIISGRLLKTKGWRVERETA